MDGHRNERETEIKRRKENWMRAYRVELRVGEVYGGFKKLRQCNELGKTMKLSERMPVGGRLNACFLGSIV